jgi:hypothetical protein
MNNLSGATFLGRLYRIHNIPFSSQLMNQPNKLVCSITLSWKGLPVTNTLTYWASSLVTNKMKCCEYAPKPYPPGWKDSPDKHSSLLVTLVNYIRKSF